jgi:glucose/arabinose dehydrogenase
MKATLARSTLAAVVAGVFATAFAQAPKPADSKAPPAAAPAPAAAPGAPAAPPIWKQGIPDKMKESKLAPHAAKMTETPVAEIPLDKLKVPQGFKVEVWAHGMPGARMMARNADGTKVWAGTRGIGRVYEVTDKGGKRETRVLVDKLTQPNGVAFKDGALYVMAIDKVLKYDGIEKNANVQPTDLTAKFNLPPKQHHNWKFLAFGPDGKLYVPFGSPCNICEPEAEYAQIRRYNADGSGMEVVARGVRNSVGFDFHPQSKELWFTDNGRDWMGNDGPEDELNRVSKVGEFFGFPYCHANGIPDQDIKKQKPCDGVTKPVITMGSHVAALGMRFYTGDMFPKEYKDQILVARRGSWNRDKLNGYDVVRVTVGADGKGAKITPFLAGFMDGYKNTFWGRPVDVMQMPDGSMLVADEQNGAIYRISYGKDDKAAPAKAAPKKDGKAKA